MQQLGPQQVDAAALTLAEAFRDDPLLKILHPDERKHDAIAPWFFSTAIKYGMPYGQVWGNEDASAVAIWLPPDGTDMSMVAMIRAGMAALPFKVGARGALRFMRALSATEPFHKAVRGPHWYLLAVGTRPERQGQGLGQSLLEQGTAQADAAGLPCYLETGTEENVAFYSKRGFEVTGQTEFQGFTLSGMVRPPSQRSAQ
jgi:GNAT superfamily N-acetyltransferase